jgi:hypothetical protein
MAMAITATIITIISGGTPRTAAMTIAQIARQSKRTLSGASGRHNARRRRVFALR